MFETGMRRQAGHKRFVLMLKNVRRTTSRFEEAACQRRCRESGQIQGRLLTWVLPRMATATTIIR
jgi:hypothetical protein